jgi:hypothetical protein
MSDDEKLRWEIATLRESIRLDWAMLASKSVTADQRKAIRERLEICISALNGFLDRLDLRHARPISQKSKLGLRQSPAVSNTRL